MTKSRSQAEELRFLLANPVDQLYGLKDIGTARTWDYSLPTISTHRGYTERINFKSDESFFKIFKDVNGGLPYRLLEHAGAFKKGNDIVLFGGCLLDIVLQRDSDIKDFDLRLIGVDFDEAKCVKQSKDFVSSVFDFLLEENEQVEKRVAAAKEEGRTLSYEEQQKCNIQEIVISRARSTVSVHIPWFGNIMPSIFQLTFAPAPTVQSMLNTCHPHCTRLAIKDGAVVLDHLARFSIESMAIVLDTASLVNFYCGDAEDENEQAKRISSGITVAGQFARLIRYHKDKGFDIILPELEMDKVPRHNLEFDVVEVLSLPCMTIVYDDIKDKQIMATNLSLPKNLASKVQDVGMVGSYDSIPTPHVGDSIHHNVRCLVNEVYDSFKYVAKGERWEHVFDFAPSLTPRMVKKTYETVSDDLNSGSIPVSRLAGYFSVTSLDEVVEKLVAKPLREEICRKGTLPKPFLLNKDVLKDLIEMEVSQLTDMILSLPDVMVSKGLDKLVMNFPQNVSSEEEVFEAIYGNSAVNRYSQI